MIEQIRVSAALVIARLSLWMYERAYRWWNTANPIAVCLEHAADFLYTISKVVYAIDVAEGSSK